MPSEGSQDNAETLGISRPAACAGKPCGMWLYRSTSSIHKLTTIFVFGGIATTTIGLIVTVITFIASFSPEVFGSYTTPMDRWEARLILLIVPILMLFASATSWHYRRYRKDWQALSFSVIALILFVLYAGRLYLFVSPPPTV